MQQQSNIILWFFFALIFGFLFDELKKMQNKI